MDFLGRAIIVVPCLDEAEHIQALATKLRCQRQNVMV